MIRLWFGFWIWLLYAARLRRPLNNLQRRLTGERKAPRKALARLTSPDAVRNVLGRLQWRKDGTRIGGLFLPLDYISDPMVTQARLDSLEEADGDCDDAHHWAAVQLRSMQGVQAVRHVSIGYEGGGHVACVYRFESRWYLLNYGRVTPLDSPRDAEAHLLTWADRERSHWLVFETTDLERVRL